MQWDTLFYLNHKYMPWESCTCIPRGLSYMLRKTCSIWIIHWLSIYYLNFRKPVWKSKYMYTVQPSYIVLDFFSNIWFSILNLSFLEQKYSFFIKYRFLAHKNEFSPAHSIHQLKIFRLLSAIISCYSTFFLSQQIVHE